ncbi:MAG TPA: 50S ribosomal protein L4 [bacterium]|nr:50S ribosomal protein L4 [bacterium]
MPKANLYNSTGKSTGTIDLPENVFGLKPRSHHMWRGVTTYLSNQRLGTVSTKTKGDVSGGGKKPFKQKGTGNARQGSSRAVQFVGGGIAHGPKPRDYSLELPKKMRRQALAESLSAKALAGQVLVVDAIQFDAPKTKNATGLLKGLGVETKKCLVVLNGADANVQKSFRNLPKAKVLSRENLNIFEVVNHEVVVMTRQALETIGAAQEKSK